MPVAARRHRGDAPRADQGGRAAAVSRNNQAHPRDREGAVREGAAVACTTRPAWSSSPERSHELGVRARCRAGAPPRRSRDAGLHGHRHRRPHRLPADPRAPGGDAAPQGARRHPRRPRRVRAPADMDRLRHRPDRPRRVEPVPVRLGSDGVRARRRPSRGRDRHRRPGDDPGRSQEPRVTSSVVTDPADYDVVLDELRAIGAHVGRDAPAPGAQGVRRHRRLRRRRRRVARRRRAAARVAPPRVRAGAARAALRREPAPARRAVPRRGRRAVVGRHDPARRHGAVVPQPVRRRRRLAARARHRTRREPAGVRHHQARQPVRRGRRRNAGRRLPARVRVRRALGVRRHRRPEPIRSTTRPSSAWSRPRRPTS